jgi:hypothetical protein
MRNAYNILVGKLEGKRSFGGPRRTWEDNIRMDMWEGMEWMQLDQDKGQWRVLVNTIVILLFP